MTDALTARKSTIISSKTIDSQFTALTDMIAATLAVSSRRVYANTYRQWSAFVERNGLDTFDLSYENILAFLQENNIAYATRYPLAGSGGLPVANSHNEIAAFG